MKKIRIIAIVCAIVAAIALFSIMQNQEEKKRLEEQQQQQTATVDLVVAAVDIPEHTIVTADMVTIKAIPEEFVIAGSYSNPENVIGKMVTVNIKTGEQIISERAKVVGDRNFSSTALLVEEGMRAITIPVSNISGVAGMLRPSDHVDIVLYGVVNGKATSRTFLSDIEILAVDNVTSTAGKDGYGTVTLHVTALQANQIDWAGNNGSFRLVLRTPLEQGAAAENSVTGIGE